MSKFWKAAAVLFVGLPLWFIAWRMYDEWRVRSAYRRYIEAEWRWRGEAGLDDEAKTRAYHAAAELWDNNFASFRSLGLRHPSEWKP